MTTPLFNADDLQRASGVLFNNVRLYEEAFTHRSYMNENKHRTKINHERLEFLGDAVLQLTVSAYLFKKYTSVQEGVLTRHRASIVCEPTLAAASRKLQFGKYVLLGRGEEQTGGRDRPALLADLFESFVGALYLDQGLEVVAAFLEQHLLSQVVEDELPDFKDYKSALQVWVQTKMSTTVHYEISDQRGPSHDREFEACVILNGERLGSGWGRSKKEAEQIAASQAIQKLRIEI